MKLETVKLNSNFLQFVNVSTYSGVFEINSMYSHTTDYFPEFIEAKETDWDAYGKTIGEYYIEVLKDNFLGELPYYRDYDIDSIRFYMPVAYNFADDSFSVDLTIDLDAMMLRFKEIIDKHSDTVEEFLCNYWRSRSGFISFVPETISELNEYADNIQDSEKASVILAFILNIEYLLENQSFQCDYDIFAYENMTGNTIIYDFTSYQLTYNDKLSAIITSNGTNESIAKAIEAGLVTSEELSNISGLHYGEDILKALNTENDFYDEAEIPVDDMDMAIYVAIKLKNKEEEFANLFN